MLSGLPEPVIQHRAMNLLALPAYSQPLSWLVVLHSIPVLFGGSVHCTTATEALLVLISIATFSRADATDLRLSRCYPTQGKPCCVGTRHLHRLSCVYRLAPLLR